MGDSSCSEEVPVPVSRKRKKEKSAVKKRSSSSSSCNEGWEKGQKRRGGDQFGRGKRMGSRPESRTAKNKEAVDGRRELRKQEPGRSSQDAWTKETDRFLQRTKKRSMSNSSD